MADAIRYLPLLSASMLYLIVIVQAAKGRFTRMTEAFFGLTMFLAGSYALSDFLLFNSSTAGGALLAAKLSMSFLDLCAVALLLFTISFHRTPKRSWLSVLPLTAFFLMASWTAMVQGVEMAPWGWKVTLSSEFFLAFFAYLFFYVFAGVIHMNIACRKLTALNKSAGLRSIAVTSSFAFILVAGAALVAMTGGSTTIPVFSTLLLIPAFATFPLLMPAAWESWISASKGGRMHRPEVKAAYLMYEDGTIIQSRSTTPAGNLESTLLPKALDIIQSFVRTSFPLISGKWLKAIDHGDMRIIVERGEHTCLALVLSGRENELLRKQMRDVLSAFEAGNGLKTPDWLSASHDAARGAKEAVEYFFARESLF